VTTRGKRWGLGRRSCTEWWSVQDTCVVLSEILARSPRPTSTHISQFISNFKFYSKFENSRGTLHITSGNMLKFSHTCYQALGLELIPVYRCFKSFTGDRLPLLSTRPAVTFPSEERHRPSTSTKIYCLVTEAHRCEQLAQGCYAALSWWDLNPRPIDCKSDVLLPRDCSTYK